MWILNLNRVDERWLLLANPICLLLYLLFLRLSHLLLRHLALYNQVISILYPSLAHLNTLLPNVNGLGREPLLHDQALFLQAELLGKQVHEVSHSQRIQVKSG